MIECSCGMIYVGLTESGQRNWSPDCLVHGLGSEWYNDDAQVAAREAQDFRSRELQARAKAARKARS